MPVPLKRYQKDFDYAYTFGVFPTLELLHHAPQHVISVLTHSKGQRNQGVQKIAALCAERRIRIEENDSSVERITSKGNDWAVGIFRKYEANLDPAANHVVLVSPSDMGNLGTILRTMLSFGIADLALIRPAADIFDPRAVRASMGALFQSRFAYFDDFDDYQNQGDRALYPFITGTQTTLNDVAFAPPFSLIFGNESAGLPDAFRTVGIPVGIPITDRVDSLNLSIAVGIGLYASRSGDTSAV